MKMTYDEEARAFYIYTREGEQIARTETVLDGDILINLDKDVEGNTLGVEILLLNAGEKS
jgi:uncharacterized protein YuzE